MAADGAAAVTEETDAATLFSKPAPDSKPTLEMARSKMLGKEAENRAEAKPRSPQHRIDGHLAGQYRAETGTPRQGVAAFPIERSLNQGIRKGVCGLRPQQQPGRRCR